MVAWPGLIIHALVLGVLCLILTRSGPIALGAVLACFCLRELLASIQPWLFVRKRLPTTPFRRVPAPAGIYFLSLATFANAGYFYIDTFMLKEMRTDLEVGNYGLAVRVLVPLVMALSLLLSPYLPFLSRATRGKEPAGACRSTEGPTPVGGFVRSWSGWSRGTMGPGILTITGRRLASPNGSSRSICFTRARLMPTRGSSPSNSRGARGVPAAR